MAMLQRWPLVILVVVNMLIPCVVGSLKCPTDCILSEIENYKLKVRAQLDRDKESRSKLIDYPILISNPQSSISKSTSLIQALLQSPSVQKQFQQKVFSVFSHYWIYRHDLYEPYKSVADKLLARESKVCQFESIQCAPQNRRYLSVLKPAWLETNSICESARTFAGDLSHERFVYVQTVVH